MSLRWDIINKEWRQKWNWVVFDGKTPIAWFRQKCDFFDKYCPWLWPLTVAFQNLISSWPDYGNFFCKFWLKYLQWFWSYRVHKISMSVVAWPWPLNPWPWKCHQCHANLVVSNCIMSYVCAFRIYQDDKRTHRRTYNHDYMPFSANIGGKIKNRRKGRQN